MIVIGAVVVIALVAMVALLQNRAMAGDAMPNEEVAVSGLDDAMQENGGTAMKAEDGAEEKDQRMPVNDDAMMAEAGSYVAYAPDLLADANHGKVVLFFRASWCPTCRALDKDIRANAAKIPAGVTILDVDYDTSTQLKQKYGVTTQHTLVQVDAQGNKIVAWKGSPALADLVARIQ